MELDIFEFSDTIGAGSKSACKHCFASVAMLRTVRPQLLFGSKISPLISPVLHLRKLDYSNQISCVVVHRIFVIMLSISEEMYRVKSSQGEEKALPGDNHVVSHFIHLLLSYYAELLNKQ